MQTFNFDLRYIETSLSMLKEIEECEYECDVDLLGTRGRNYAISDS